MYKITFKKIHCSKILFFFYLTDFYACFAANKLSSNKGWKTLEVSTITSQQDCFAKVFTIIILYGQKKGKHITAGTFFVMNKYVEVFVISKDIPW